MRLRGLPAAIAAMLLAAGCSGQPSASVAPSGGSGNANAPTAKVGWLYSLVMTGVYRMADHTDDVNVELVRFESGVDEIRALEAGDIDLAAMAYQQFISSVAQGQDFVAVSGVALNGVELVVSPDVVPGEDVDEANAAYVGTEPWELLRGKTIATLPGTYPDMACRQYLTEHGMDPLTDVTFINTPTFPEQIQAIVRGDADAACGLNPFPIQARSKGEALLLDYPYPRDEFNYLRISTVLVARASTVAEHPELIAGAVNGLVASTDALNADRQAWIDGVLEYLPFERTVIELGIDPPDDKDASLWENASLDYKLYGESVQRWVPLMAELGIIEAEDLDALTQDVIDRFDYHFLEDATGKAADELGQGE